VTAYMPHNPLTIVLLMGFAGAIWLLGIWLSRRPAVAFDLLLAWCLAVANAAGMERIVRDEPPGVRMVVLILTLLWSMKIVVATASRLDGGPALPWWRWAVFLFGWPGMQPATFAKPLRPNATAARQLALRGLGRIGMGIVCLMLARTLAGSEEELPFGTATSTAATGWLLIGVSLVLHFGLFNGIAAAWQAVGFHCQPLFRAPLFSASLSEFWSRRWNLAFSEMTAIAVYRPCQRRIGQSGALFAGFAFSGLLHEAAITVPIQSGYGGPLTYFLLHGLLVLLERRLDLPRRLGGAYRLVIVMSLVLPLPILFPPIFLREIVWPLAGK
jgi:hypothetical protein